MSRELMFVEHPEAFEKLDLDPSAALRVVYRSYGFSLPDEIPTAGLIVAAQTGEDEPEPISRDDYFADTLDPVRRKASREKGRRVVLRRMARRGNMLVFVFDA